MDRILIFNHHLGGHQLEYMHHLYMSVINKKHNTYYFAIPKEKFAKVSSEFEWPEYKHINLMYIDDGKIINTHKNYIVKSYELSKLLHKTIKETNTTKIFLIGLINFLPALPFIIKKNIKISGILYKVNLYRWSYSNLFIRIQDSIKDLLFVKSDVFDKIFILNDKAATVCLNKIYKTKKFHFLPDPIIPIKKNNFLDLRIKLSIDHSKIIILHPGGMQRRKGTIELLKAIYISSQDIKDKFTFIFAGQVTNEIKSEFYYYYNKLKNSVQIIIFDEFCSFELLSNLFYTCDYIMIPYIELAQSSGIIGFGAQFKKPIVAPKGGIVGKLIKRNHLGVLLNSGNYQSILNFLTKPINWKYKKNSYLILNDINKFVEKIDL